MRYNVFLISLVVLSLHVVFCESQRLREAVGRREQDEVRTRPAPGQQDDASYRHTRRSSRRYRNQAAQLTVIATANQIRNLTRQGAGRRGERRGGDRNRVGRPNRRHRHRHSGNSSTQTYPWPQNCTHCRIREEMKRYRTEAVKQQILSKLRMKSPPNITGRNIPDIPQIRALMRSYNNMPMLGDSPQSVSGNEEDFVPPDDDTDDYHATILKVINFAENVPPEKNFNISDVCYFTFQPEVIRSIIIRASFWVYLREAEDTSTRQQSSMILLYRLKTPSDRSPEPEQELVSVRSIFLSETGAWFQFDVKKIVENWIAEPNGNYGLKFLAFDYQGRRLAIINPENSAEESYRPFVEIRIQDRGQSRPKRMLGINCHERSTEERCCRYPLVVDFEEFGWDWVIAPKRYSAYYCSGDCPYAFFQKFAHTTLTTLAISQGSMGPCCSPTKLSSLSLLYFDIHFRVIYGSLPGMVADRCGCT